MRFIPLFYYIYLVFLAVVLVSIGKYNSEINEDISQRQFDMQVNYAVDAATDVMLSNTTSFLSSYEDYDIVVDPRVAYTTYLRVMATTYGSLADFYVTDVENDTIAFCVAATDGFYLFQREPKDTPQGTAYSMVMTPKIPYRTRAVRHDAVTTINPRESTWRYDNTGGKIELPDVSPKYTDASFTINKALNAAVFTYLDGGNLEAVEVIGQASMVRSLNNVQSPTCIALLQREGVINYAIGGTRIVLNKGYLAWKDSSGKLYYTHATERTAEMDKFIEKYTVRTKWFPTAEKAASAGYFYKEVNWSNVAD